MAAFLEPSPAALGSERPVWRVRGWCPAGVQERFFQEHQDACGLAHLVRF